MSFFGRIVAYLVLVLAPSTVFAFCMGWELWIICLCALHGISLGLFIVFLFYNLCDRFTNKKVGIFRIAQAARFCIALVCSFAIAVTVAGFILRELVILLGWGLNIIPPNLVSIVGFGVMGLAVLLVIYVLRLPAYVIIKPLSKIFNLIRKTLKDFVGE